MAASRTVFLRGNAYGLCEECAYELEPQRRDYIERPGSRVGTTIALWTLAGVVSLGVGWVLNSVLGVF